MTVRLPSADAYVAQIDKEHQWLPLLRDQLPLPIPEPLAKGMPSPEFPRPWSVYRWIDGETASIESISNLEQFARDLAGFLSALYRCDTTNGPPPGPHSFARGGPVSVWDAQTRQALERLDGRLDVPGARAVWQAALDATWDAPPVWVHGDVTGSNLLVRDGRLAAVIDFGCSAVGDPACDTTTAWTFFEGDSRRRFKSALDVDRGVWARGRGWALWKALRHLERNLSEPGYADAVGLREGWRLSGAETVNAIIRDLRHEGS